MAGFTSDASLISALWRPFTDAESAVAVTWLAAAETVLTASFPTIAARIADGTLDPALVEFVQVQMVLRVLKNPDGKRQETIDDYSWTRDSAVSSGLLTVSDDERALLTPSSQQGSAFTISPFGEPGYSARPLNWWELNL